MSYMKGSRDYSCCCSDCGMGMEKKIEQRHQIKAMFYDLTLVNHAQTLYCSNCKTDRTTLICLPQEKEMYEQLIMHRMTNPIQLYTSEWLMVRKVLGLTREEYAEKFGMQVYDVGMCETVGCPPLLELPLRKLIFDLMLEKYSNRSVMKPVMDSITATGVLTAKYESYRIPLNAIYHSPSQSFMFF